MTTRSRIPVSRRAGLVGLVGLGATSLSVGLTTRTGRAAAQEDTDLAGHPLAGTWAAATVGGIVPQTHHADGSIIAAFPPNYLDPGLGLTFQGPALGSWESTGARTGRFTIIQALTDVAGAYLGTFQLTAEIEASADGLSWTGINLPRVIMRDAANMITVDDMLPLDPPVTGSRIGATSESVRLQPMTTAATPTP